MKEKDIINFLKDIENGKLSINPLINLEDVYSDNIIYSVNNGWEITIFKDGDFWDYIDNIKTSNGEIINFNQLDSMINVRNYEPPLEIAKRVYGLDIEK
ncbi:MAG: hypothetical protein WCY77_02400 [Weeksellaceae bacterium]